MKLQIGDFVQVVCETVRSINLGKIIGILENDRFLVRYREAGAKDYYEESFEGKDLILTTFDEYREK